MDLSEPDWRTLATAFGDAVPHAVVALDPNGTVLFANSAMESRLGWRRHEIVGRPFSQLWRDRQDGSTARGLAEVSGGLRRTLDIVLQGRESSLIALTFDFTLIGRTGGSCLLAVAREASPATTPARGTSLTLLEIATSPDDFGKIHAAWVGDAPLPRALGDRCYAFVRRRDCGCTSCPAKGDARADGRSATTDTGVGRTCSRLRMASEPGRAVVAVSEDGGSALIRLAQSRVDALADRHALSVRERECLDHLIVGRSLEEMAQEMKITVRTVKFHQANVLNKLGADSRVDLLRIFF